MACGLIVDYAGEDCAPFLRPPPSLEYTVRGRAVQGSAGSLANSRWDNDLPLGGGHNSHFPRLAPEAGTMVNPKSRLRLPLMHHLVQEGVLHLRPIMPQEMPPADSNFPRLTSVPVGGKLAQPALHPAGQANRDIAEGATEMTDIEGSVQFSQPIQQCHVSGAGALNPRALTRCDIGRDWKSQEFTLGLPSAAPRDARIEELNDGSQHLIRSKSVSPVETQCASTQTQHHRRVGVGLNPIHFDQPKSPKSLGQTLFEEKALARYHSP
jgi:hypothetical protein